MLYNIVIKISRRGKIFPSHSKCSPTELTMMAGFCNSATDTAIAFRKISRGSIWLEYNPWREFLEELATRKGLNMAEVSIPTTSKLYIFLSGSKSTRIMWQARVERCDSLHSKSHV